MVSTCVRVYESAYVLWVWSCGCVCRARSCVHMCSLSCHPLRHPVQVSVPKLVVAEEVLPQLSTQVRGNTLGGGEGEGRERGGRREGEGRGGEEAFSTSCTLTTNLPMFLKHILHVCTFLCSGVGHTCNLSHSSLPPPTHPSLLPLTPLKTLILNFLSFSSLMRPSKSLYDSHSTRLTGALRLRFPGRGGIMAWRRGGEDTHTHTHIHAHTYVYTHIHTHVHVRMHSH